MRLLSTGLYYMQVVGKVQLKEPPRSANAASNGDIEMTNGGIPQASDGSRVKWHLEFKDTPEAGKQALSTRFVAKIPIEDGDVIKFMKEFGYE